MSQQPGPVSYHTMGISYQPTGVHGGCRDPRRLAQQMLLNLGNPVPWVFGQCGEKHLSQMMLSLAFRTMIKWERLQPPPHCFCPQPDFQDPVRQWSPSPGSDKEASPSAPRAALPRVFEATVPQGFSTSIWDRMEAVLPWPLPVSALSC